MAQTASNGVIHESPLRGTFRARHGLIIGALGVVYGDIGTSPLYTVRQCFDGIGSIRPESIWGVLSLIAWSLFIVVTLKYIIVIMRADNRGEGGILALTALALRAANRGTRAAGWIIAAGMIGAALFYGDGVITPAISVLSAVEGLKVATPVFEPYILPNTVVLLVALLAFQRRGTGIVGEFFGPIMVLWFVVLACLG
ncbi:MAG: KUP/HAK/KT family potassium transporter, partial [Stellaceae bacterium]